MIRIKYLVLTLLLGTIALNISNAQHNIDQSDFSDLASTVNRNLDKRANIKGSPYINDTFHDLTFKRFGDKIFTGRYDANLGEMQIKRGNDTIVINNFENFEITFALNNKVYKTYSYTDKKDILKRGFLVVLKETDSLALLKEELVKFYQAKESTNGYDKAKPAEYRRTKDVYYYRQGEHVSVLPQKRKDFIKLFPEHSKDLEVFIKKNKINFKQEDDLITLFQYLETL
ncbi:hypothetical protein [Winogradskyella eximia]|uniref:hypothetical protein n=1 Tax=Winogradskyella eximia TaxID=262006 RepID=UPI00249088FF|nr:hypothetical protein [Winogradskyella eximia]